MFIQQVMRLTHILCSIHKYSSPHQHFPVAVAVYTPTRVTVNETSYNSISADIALLTWAQHVYCSAQRI